MNGYKYQLAHLDVSVRLPTMNSSSPVITDCSVLEQSGASFATTFIGLCFIIFCGLICVYLWSFGTELIGLVFRFELIGLFLVIERGQASDRVDHEAIQGESRPDGDGEACLDDRASQEPIVGDHEVCRGWLSERIREVDQGLNNETFV